MWIIRYNPTNLYHIPLGLASTWIQPHPSSTPTFSCALKKKKKISRTASPHNISFVLFFSSVSSCLTEDTCWIRQFYANKFIFYGVLYLRELRLIKVRKNRKKKKQKKTVNKKLVSVIDSFYVSRKYAINLFHTRRKISEVHYIRFY